ncbi:MAG: class I SAM-dependent rRNA methyltransferase [Pseudomonadota bacterium]
MTSEALPIVRLKRHEDRRIREGHLWVFSNEIDTGKTPLTEFEPGAEARLEASDGKPLGIVYVNPASLIACRVMSRDSRQRIERSLLTHRVNVAIGLRERLYGEPSGRLIYGEADRLPGLVVDRFGDVLVGQITTAGMERMREPIASILQEKLDCSAMIWRNDGAMRGLEGLDSYVTMAFGEQPERLSLTEGGVPFSVAAGKSQKTGWFFDQRANRDLLAPYVKGRRVLDLFCYAGGWGVRAALAGASAVTFVDSGEQAIADVAENVATNGIEARAQILRDDAFRYLEAALADGERFDVVIVDPPAFAKRRKDVKNALNAYRRVNELALRLLDRDGFLVTCSCSHHVRADRFLDTVLKAGRHVDRQLQRVTLLQQAPDHPVHPAIPETEYLKGAIFRSTVN